MRKTRTLVFVDLLRSMEGAKVPLEPVFSCIDVSILTFRDLRSCAQSVKIMTCSEDIPVSEFQALRMKVARNNEVIADVFSSGQTMVD